jgi:hypothetical protein
MNKAERIEVLAKLQIDLIRKNKEFTDAIKNNVPYSDLKVIFLEIQSIFAEMSTIKKTISE